jgi:ferredoxin
MGKLVSVSIENEGAFKAYRGDTLLDAALLNGFDMPHDCRAGTCGSCRVRVFLGRFTGVKPANPVVFWHARQRFARRCRSQLMTFPQLTRFQRE